MTARAPGALVVLWMAGSAHAEPTLPQPEPIAEATPILAIDDTRTHGPTARNHVDVALDARRIQAPDGQGVESLAGQLSIGLPTLGQRDARDLLAPYTRYVARLRVIALHAADGWHAGPLTLAGQRYVAVAPVAIAPLVYAHAGVELAVSTPWLSDRRATPPRAVQIVDGVDTELAENGWSLRPLSGYVRADFLACRSAYGELGGAPELFVPGAGPTGYHVRAHAALGWSFGCSGRAAASRPKVVIEYRGRMRLHAGDAPMAYRDSLGIGLQYDHGGLVVQLLMTADPGAQLGDYWTLGLRVQLGRAKGG